MDLILYYRICFNIFQNFFIIILIMTKLLRNFQTKQMPKNFMVLAVLDVQKLDSHEIIDLSFIFALKQ